MNGRLRNTIVAVVITLSLGPALARDAHILDGEDWLRLDHSHKVMFVSGISQILEMERHLVSEGYTRDSASFIPQMVEGLQGMTIGDIIERVDRYYQGSFERLQHTVVDAIFRAIIYPKAEGTYLPNESSGSTLDTPAGSTPSTKLDP